MKNKIRRSVSISLAAIMLVGLLAGCGGDTGQDAGTNPGGDIMSPEEELQSALNREEQADKDAVQEELDKMAGNTKPGGEAGGRPNSGDGNGMAGLGDAEDPDGDASAPGEDPGENGGDIPGGEYGYDGTYSIPDGFPKEMTMEALGVPEWDGRQPWAAINGNTPFFEVPDSRPKFSETYSSLDKMRRPGYGRIVINGMVEEKKDYSVTIQQGTLSVPGWNVVSYPGVIANIDSSKIASGTAEDGQLFYIRRIIGSELTMAEIGRRNTIVCTQYAGEYGLRTLENAVMNYLQRVSRRVIYRVTPVFEGKEEVARGFVVEAMSYGDSAADLGAGRDLCFCMFVYNVQPGVIIDYRDGSSRIDDSADPKLSSTVSGAYVLDTARKQAHKTNCYQLVRDVSPAVQSYYYGTVEELVNWSYDWNACDCMYDDYVPPVDVEGPEEDPNDPDAKAELEEARKT